jgi:hypothetical protein
MVCDEVAWWLSYEKTRHKNYFCLITSKNCKTSWRCVNIFLFALGVCIEMRKDFYMISFICD